MVKRIMRRFRMNEISAVDRPAQKGAKMTIMKRDDSTSRLSAAIAKAWVGEAAQPFSDFLQASLEKDSGVVEEIAPAIDAMESALKSISSDDGLKEPEKLEKMQGATQEFLDAIRDEWPTVETTLSEVFASEVQKGEQDMFDYAKAEDQVSELEDAVSKLEDDLKKEGGPDLVAISETIEDCESAISELDESLGKAEGAEAAKLQKKVTRLTKKVLSAAEIAKTFGEKKKTDEEEAAEAARCKKAADDAANDDVLKVDGNEIKKSVVGDGVFSVLKAQQAQIEKAEGIAKDERNRREMGEFTKRAEEDLGHLPGKPVEKALVLKAMGGLEKDVQATLETMLKAGEAAIKSAYGALGGGGGNDNGGDPKAFEKRVSEVAARDKISKTEAMAKARLEYPEEFATYQGSN